MQRTSSTAIQAALVEEAQLHREREERFRRLFEETRQALTLVEDGRFVAANRAALAMLHMDNLAQLIGRSPADISPELQPDGRPTLDKTAEVIETAFKEGSNAFEWEYLRADGEPFTAMVLLTAIKQGDKDLLHVAWNDITEQKKAERELAEYRRDLEIRVAARTRELTEMAESLRLASAEQKAILDSASAGIVMLKDRIVISCNRNPRLSGRLADRHVAPVNVHRQRLFCACRCQGL